MVTFKFLKFFFIVSLLSSTSCTNTRLLLEGTKKIIKKEKISQNKNFENENLTIGHYKVGNEYKVAGQKYKPKLYSKYDETGIASWYGPKFHLKKTANGEIFDQNQISAAHKTLPLPSLVKVTKIKNNRIIYLRVNDRGPFVNNRIIDFSKKAAIYFNFFEKGIEEVRVQLLESGPHLLEKKYLNHNFLSKYAKNIEKSNFVKADDKQFKLILQIGAFREKSNALNLLNFLKTKIDDNLYLLDNNGTNGEKVYKVFAGPFYKEQKADIAAQKLIELGFNILLKKE